MSGGGRRRANLLEKVSGPNAVPLAALIQKGEAAAQKVHQSFGSFLDQRILELARLRPQLANPEEPAWREIYEAEVDLLGTAATAGRKEVSAVCASLELLMRQLGARIDWDAKAARVLGSHVDALMLLTSERAPKGAAMAMLVEELEQAVARLIPESSAS